MVQLVRNECVILGSADLEHLYTFDNFPVFMGCSDGASSEDLYAPMSWWISKASGVVQLKELIPLEVLYPESHGAGEVGNLWRHHHSAFADFVHQLAPRSVFEIGGAHGILETEHRKYGEVPWTILEPNPHPTPETKAKFVRGFFDENFQSDVEFDTVVHSHLFEHVYDPVSFMEALKNFMPEGTNLAFSLPNMAEMLRRKYTNCINFEHTILLTEPYIEFLLASHGFEVRRKEYFQEDHSIFFSAVRNPSTQPLPFPDGLFDLYRELYGDYIRYHEELVSDLNKKIAGLDSPTYLFGAHIFTQYLIASGLDTSGIVGILDNDRAKHGRRLYGTDLFVSSPAVLRDAGEVNVVLKAGGYNDEIILDILENHNQACVFLP